MGEMIPKHLLTDELKIGNRTYKMIDFVDAKKNSVDGATMCERAEQMGVDRSEEDGQYLLDHREDIPEELRDHIIFPFTDWRVPNRPDCAYYVSWYGGEWIRGWRWLGNPWGGCFLLRTS